MLGGGMLVTFGLKLVGDGGMARDGQLLCFHGPVL